MCPPDIAGGNVQIGTLTNNDYPISFCASGPCIYSGSIGGYRFLRQIILMQELAVVKMMNVVGVCSADVPMKEAGENAACLTALIKIGNMVVVIGLKEFSLGCPAWKIINVR
jgi:hypothetical protein